MEQRTFECAKCANVWSVEPCSEGGRHGYEIACPKCGEMAKSKVMADGTRSACGGHGHVHAQGAGQGCGCGCSHGK